VTAGPRSRRATRTTATRNPAIAAAGMAYFRRRSQVDPVREHLLRDAETKLDVFCA